MTTCPHCTNSDKSMIELLVDTKLIKIYLCAVCGKSWQEKIDAKV